MVDYSGMIAAHLATWGESVTVTTGAATASVTGVFRSRLDARELGNAPAAFVTAGVWFRSSDLDDLCVTQGQTRVELRGRCYVAAGPVDAQDNGMALVLLRRES